jgi:hypothetical protein
MNAAYVSAFAALAGSVIGGLTTFAAAWITQQNECRLQPGRGRTGRKGHSRDRRHLFLTEQDLVRAARDDGEPPVPRPLTSRYR